MSDDTLTDWLRDAAPSPGRIQVRAAADELRRLSVALLRADTDRFDGTELDRLLGHLRDACDDLALLPAIPADLTPAGRITAPTFLSERSPVSGAANVVAAPLTMTHLPGLTRGVATFTELHEGPSRHVHGGVIAATFDELLGVAQVHSGAAGYTTELTIRFRKITPLFEPIVHEARVVDRDDRNIHVEATSFRQAAPDVVLAQAAGTFRAQAHLVISDHLTLT